MELNTIYSGDALETLQTFPDNSIDCCVTSPPYFGLRDYGVSGQIGLEELPIEYIQNLVNVFHEVKRVLTPTGICWVNIKDSYSGYKGDNYAHKPFGADRSPDHTTPPPRKSFNYKTVGFKPKDLIGIPWMLAFGMRDDGWYLRSDTIWNKTNPTPEGVSSRPTCCHEYMFMFSKQYRHYYDAESVKEMGVSGEKRHLRSVRTLSTNTYRSLHAAAYPPELIIPCIIAGCPEGGTVLDPFMGSGTTGLVASQLNRNYVGIELNSEYIDIAMKRINGTG